MFEKKEERVLALKAFILATIVIMVFHFAVLFLIYGFSNPISNEKFMAPHSLWSWIIQDDNGTLYDLPHISRWLDPLMWPILFFFLYPMLMITKGVDQFFSLVLCFVTVTVAFSILPFGLFGGISVFITFLILFSIINLPVLMFFWLGFLAEKIYDYVTIEDTEKISEKEEKK